jgi:hypothetical protein
VIVDVVIDKFIGKGGVDVLIDNVQNDRHADFMAGVYKTFEAIGPAEASVRGKIVQRAVPPIEIKLDAGNRHELETVDAQALEVVEALHYAVEGVVELFDLYFVDDKIIELWRLIRGVGPHE